MKAAVVMNLSNPPQYVDFEEPTATAGSVFVHVEISATDGPEMRRTSGRHFAEDTPVPFVPGSDGVGRLNDGRRVYFAFAQPPFGSLAEKTVVDADCCIEIPDELDSYLIAAVGGPGLVSRVALTDRAGFAHGESVLVNGADGAAGAMAIQIAKYLGASRVVATVSDEAAVQSAIAVGADVVLSLDQKSQRLVHLFQQELMDSDVGIVLDYLWGTSATCLIEAIATLKDGCGRATVRLVQVGSASTSTLLLSSSAFQDSRFELLGSGSGNISRLSYLRALRNLLASIGEAKYSLDFVAVPLADVESKWNPLSTRRTVFVI